MTTPPRTIDNPAPKSKKENVSGVTPWLGGIRLEEAITIRLSVSTIYAYWRDFNHFPDFCKQLRAVTVLDNNRSRWTANGPGDNPLTWEALLVDDLPNELISWRSLEKSEFDNEGSVRFREAPGGRGTEIRFLMTYNPPAGPLGSLIPKMTGREPALLLREQLRRLKQLLEMGELSTTEGQPAVVES